MFSLNDLNDILWFPLGAKFQSGLTQKTFFALFSLQPLQLRGVTFSIAKLWSQSEVWFKTEIFFVIKVKDRCISKNTPKIDER